MLPQLDKITRFKLLPLYLVPGTRSFHHCFSFCVLVGSADLSRGVAGCQEPLATMDERDVFKESRLNRTGQVRWETSPRF